MSRFLPRPPPSYKREDVSLIGSIKTGAQKLQNEIGKSKQRIENSREKNEKENRKRSREERDKLHYLEGINKKRRRDKRVKFNESCLDASKGDPDLLERSDLSEEYDPPAFVLKQCNSSESAQSSNKLRDGDPNRKKQGLVIRIKLPSKKQKDPEPASQSAEPCTSFLVTKSSNIQVGLSESCLQRKNVPLVQLEDTKPLPAAEDPCFSGRVAQAPIASQANLSESRHVSSSSRRHGGHRARKSEKRFTDLILNWKALPIQVVEADAAGDQDWLFAPRQPQHEKPILHNCRAVIPESDVCPSTEGSLQPRACYIPELDAYQLPYVIPF